MSVTDILSQAPKAFTDFLFDSQVLIVMSKEDNPKEEKDIIINMNVTKLIEHSRQASITKHAVEKGVDISDHVKPEPFSMSLECVLSNSMPVWMENLLGKISFLKSFLPFSVIEKREKLDYICVKGLLVTVSAYEKEGEAGKFIYGNGNKTNNLVISSIQERQSTEFGTNGLGINISLSEIRVVQFQTTDSTVKFKPNPPKTVVAEKKESILDVFTNKTGSILSKAQ